MAVEGIDAPLVEEIGEVWVTEDQVGSPNSKVDSMFCFPVFDVCYTST